MYIHIATNAVQEHAKLLETLNKIVSKQNYNTIVSMVKLITSYLLCSMTESW